MSKPKTDMVRVGMENLQNLNKLAVILETKTALELGREFIRVMIELADTPPKDRRWPKILMQIDASREQENKTIDEVAEGGAKIGVEEVTGQSHVTGETNEKISERVRRAQKG